MIREEEIKLLLEKTQFQVSDFSKRISLLLIAIGLIAFFAAMFTGYSSYAWQALLINTIFFAGFSHAGLMFSIMLTITDAFWGRPFKRFAEAMASFAPVSLFLFVLLFFALPHFFEWVDHDKVIHSKEGWLNTSFFIQRNLFLFLLLGILSYIYIKTSIRPDIGYARTLSFPFSNKLADLFSKDYGNHDQEHEKAYHKNKQLAPWLAFVYLLTASFVAFDWISSIDQEWFSTMFGVQYFVSNLISAGAFLLLILSFYRSKYDLGDYLTISRYHDLAKMVFAFTLLWSYMIFSQILIIWYGDLHEETPFVLLRVYSDQWGWFFILLFIVQFQIPFWCLMSRTTCSTPSFVRFVAINILIGGWLEKYFLITPSLQENFFVGTNNLIPGFEVLPFLIDVLVGIGILGLFLTCFFGFLKRVPIVPVSDYRLHKVTHH